MYTSPVLERLQKILSARGIASRRKAEEYLAAGLVLVNGKPAKVGDKADPDIDLIEVKGEVLEARRDLLYYLFWKPVGVITSNVDRSEGKPKQAEPLRGYEVTKSSLERIRQRETSKRPEALSRTVRDLLPVAMQGKVFPVGRLDKDSEGLLLLTNDGVVAYRLTHPKFDHEKEYEVEVDVPVTPMMVKRLQEGVIIDDSKTKPASVEKTGVKTLRIAITEGRNRQVRRMCSKVGAEVKSLKRVRIVTLTDDTLKPGKFRPLTDDEKHALFKAIGIDYSK